MSLIQVWIEDHKARVAVDTLSIQIAVPGQSGQCDASKVLPLPHAGVVLAYRGSGLAFFQFFAQLFLTAGNDDFDSLTSLVPMRVQHAASQFPKNVPMQAATFDLFVVGYSAAAGKMGGRQFAVNLLDGTAPVIPLSGCRVGPGVKEVPPLDTDDAMLSLARLQVEWMTENEPSDATGGRLLVVEVTREGMAILDAGAIEA